jgi:hypothetical protein
MTLVAFAIVILIISGTQLALLAMVSIYCGSWRRTSKATYPRSFNLTAKIRRLENLLKRQREDLP